MGIILNADGRDTGDRLDCEKLFEPADRPRDPLAWFDMNDRWFQAARDTAKQLERDADARRLNEPVSADPEPIEAWLSARVPGLVTWAGWQAIDRHETSAGEPHGRPRVKVVRVPEMIAIAERD